MAIYYPVRGTHPPPPYVCVIFKEVRLRRCLRVNELWTALASLALLLQIFISV